MNDFHFICVTTTFLWYGRLAQGVNAEMKKYQGRDSMDIKKQYEDFFLSEFEDALPDTDGVERDQAKKALCMIFQVIIIIVTD